MQLQSYSTYKTNVTCAFAWNFIIQTKSVHIFCKSIVVLKRICPIRDFNGFEGIRSRKCNVKFQTTNTKISYEFQNKKFSLTFNLFTMAIITIKASVGRESRNNNVLGSNDRKELEDALPT